MERLNGRADAVKTPIGHLPTRDALDSDGLDLADTDLDTLLSVDPEVWKQEAALVPEHSDKFGDHLPQRLWDATTARTQVMRSGSFDGNGRADGRSLCRCS